MRLVYIDSLLDDFPGSRELLGGLEELGIEILLAKDLNEYCSCHDFSNCQGILIPKKSHTLQNSNDYPALALLDNVSEVYEKDGIKVFPYNTIFEIHDYFKGK